MTKPRFGRSEWNLAYGVALRVLRSPDQAEDAAQDAMLKAFRKLHTFSGNSRFESWLYRIAYTTAISHLRSPHRKRRHVPSNDNELPTDRLVDHEADPESAARASRLSERLDECLAEMRAADRIAFTERFLLGTSERELGEVLGVSANAAKQRAFRARQAIRCRMKRH